MTTRPQTLGYGPALDGLRALAVTLALAAHLDVPHMLGGVIAVDLFFILSGFLITGILLDEPERNGQIHYPAFYVRRALRLFPGLAIRLPVVGLAAHLSTNADKATADLTTGGIPWVVLYVANWARATGTQLGLFGHTWSLAIEEQFYLLWASGHTRRLVLSPSGRSRSATIMTAVQSAKPAQYRNGDISLVATIHTRTAKRRNDDGQRDPRTEAGVKRKGGGAADQECVRAHVRTVRYAVNARTLEPFESSMRRDQCRAKDRNHDRSRIVGSRPRKDE